MGERKSYEYLNKLKKKYNVDTIYSWSRYNKAKTDPYSYMLNYIKHIKEVKKDSIYGISGGICHQILEDYYSGKIKYEDMINEYEDKLLEMNLLGLKYNRTDEEKNEAIANKYENCIRLFYKNYIPLNTKVILEQFVLIKVGRFFFQGYIDFVHKDSEGNYIIEDFKTSSIYTGKKKESEGGQLILYAESLIQKGVPLEKIKIRWNFLKYCTVVSDLFTIDKDTNKNKTKSKNCLRTEWVKDSESNIKKWLSKYGYDELEIEDMFQTCLESNSLETLPYEIQNRFRLEDCYVYLDLIQEMIDNLKQNIIETLEDIEDKTIKAKAIMNKINKLDSTRDKAKIDKLEEEIDEMFWTNIDKGNEYYFYNLCGYSRQQHKPWDEYLKETMMFVEDSFDNQFNKENDDLDWLNDL